MYPFSRADECSWHPEELSRHLSSLADKEPRRPPSDTNSINSTSDHSGSPSQLLHRGWSSRTIPFLRQSFGKNVLHDEEDDIPTNRILRTFPFLKPIGSTLIEQLKEPLILMLLFSAGISLLLGNTSDALSIGIALFIVSLVAAVQEYRSEKALEQLAHLVPPLCTCLRDGRVLDRFPAKELVVGDLVLLATGDRVPADCRVVDSIEMLVDESSLTGENHPVGKTGEGLVVVKRSTKCPSITEQTNVVFAGTLVTAGRGRALVLAVGAHTEFGKVAKELSSVTTRKSPLQNKIDELGKRLAYLSSGAIVLIALLGILMGRPFLETLTVAVSLAVAAIPEGLPICTTVTLALGVLRMSKRNAIVKKLPVVESLGCATAICSDKTGTLTQNEMTARAVYTLAYKNQTFGFTGIGYSAAAGNLVSNGLYEPKVIRSSSEEYIALAALLSTACLCNNASIPSDMDSDAAEARASAAGGVLLGQPTELALLVAAQKALVMDPRPQYHRLQEVPFSSDRKLMEVRARPVSGTHCCEAFEKTVQSGRSAFSMRRSSVDTTSMYFVKGMPEKILSACTSYTGPDGSPEPLDEGDVELVMSNARKMASSGLRVLAMAFGCSIDQLTFAGMIAMEDPPREGVAESVWQLRHGGVRVMMVTGDSRETALAIARRCGIIGTEYEQQQGLSKTVSTVSLDDFEIGLADIELATHDISIGGDDLDSMTPQRLAEAVRDVKVFYRVAPRHKLAIVRALQANGDIVAMTGDGTIRACVGELFRVRIWNHHRSDTHGRFLQVSMMLPP